MTPTQEWVALGCTTAGAIITTLGFVRIARKEQREAGANAANLAAGHLNTLSQQLMAEREASEARFNRMQDRADKLTDKVDQLERDGQHREEKLLSAEQKIAEMSRDLTSLYGYTAALEDAIRATGIAAPQRPDGLLILPGKGPSKA